MDFKNADILSAKQFNRGDIEAVLKMAKKMEQFAGKKKWADLLKDKLIASLFYEPSTRTRMSFETAAIRLGAKVISVVGAQFSSLSKGETLYDTGKVIENYADAIVIRHSKDGAAEEIASGANIPVINAGDGINEHPTQALLDIYTIQKEAGKIDGLTIAMVGDLKYGRTVHSLSLMLSHFDMKLIFVSPDELKMSEHICRSLKEKNIAYSEITNFGDALKQTDVIYMTRVQQERFSDPKEYEKFRGQYVLTRELVEEKTLNALILHPLPRIWEISRDTDDLPGAMYFKQTANGVAVRMALLALIFGKTP
ncbi:aspartate carbamoyltransferase [Candidatus Peregrinibacteria bacterium]|nr:aspartate carbamoyltransferase [Candidatus Peregrinibacteria bacterium]